MPAEDAFGSDDPGQLVELVLRLARENPTWGYGRIQGALANLGHQISDTTVAKILKDNGIEPAPERKLESTWKTFLRAHWDVLASVDFTTIDVWTRTGLVTCYLLFFMELATRRVHLAGLTPNPDEAWMLQVARNVTDAEEGFLRGKKYLLMDRDGKFSEAFRATLEQAGVEAVRLPPRSPNLNQHIERYMRCLKEECLGRMMECISYYTSYRGCSVRSTTTPFAWASKRRSDGQRLKQEMIGIGSNGAQESFLCIRPGGLGVDTDLTCNLR